jgi:hypothetical protein
VMGRFAAFPPQGAIRPTLLRWKLRTVSVKAWAAAATTHQPVSPERSLRTKVVDINAVT